MNLAPTPMMTTRLVKKQRQSRFVYALLALAAVVSIIALVGFFPVMVERAVHATVHARSGTGHGRNEHGKDEFIGRRMSPFLVSVDNAELDVRGAGTLVDEIYVLTAAHNVAMLDLGRETDTITSPSVLTVSIREEWDKPLQTRRVLKTWVHKAFSSGVGSEKLIDLAMLELESPFDKRPAGAADYWESATLATLSDLSLEAHGLQALSSAYGRIAEVEPTVRVQGRKFVGPALNTIVSCGIKEEWLQNNNTFCFAPNSHLPPHVCSGDDGGPLSVKHKGKAVVVGVIVSPPRVIGCVNPSPHRWGIAVSVARLRLWISDVIRNKPFAASRASSIQLVDHDVWTDGDNDGDVYCTSTGTAFRVQSVQPNSRNWQVKHCASGRVTSLPATNLTLCEKPCKLMTVRTVSNTLESLSMSSYQVRCSKKTGEAFRWTGRRTGFEVSDSVRMEVIPCAGGVPQWVVGNSLGHCPASVCLATPPVDWEKKLQVVCDRVGNAALLTGHKSGFWRTESVFVPVVFQQRWQVMPCHGGPPMWLYAHAMRDCGARETARCRGPEAIPRKLSSGTSAHPNDDKSDIEDEE